MLTLELTRQEVRGDKSGHRAGSGDRASSLEPRIGRHVAGGRSGLDLGADPLRADGQMVEVVVADGVRRRSNRLDGAERFLAGVLVDECHLVCRGAPCVKDFPRRQSISDLLDGHRGEGGGGQPSNPHGHYVPMGMLRRHAHNLPRLRGCHHEVPHPFRTAGVCDRLSTGRDRTNSAVTGLWHLVVGSSIPSREIQGAKPPPSGVTNQVRLALGRRGRDDRVQFALGILVVAPEPLIVLGASL